MNDDKKKSLLTKGWHCTLEVPHKLPHKAFGVGNGTHPPYDVWPAPPGGSCEEALYPWQGAYHDPNVVVSKLEFIKFFRQTTGCGLIAAKDFADKVYDDFKLLYEDESKPKPVSYDFGLDAVSQPVKQIMSEILDELDSNDAKQKNQVYKPGFKPYKPYLSGDFIEPIKPIKPLKELLDEIFDSPSEPIEVTEPEPEPAITTVDEALSTYYKEETP